ncbi:cyclic nucleotide-binding domain-containing protein [Elizabethkingia argentiflava]|uniref:Cyclic nucleotide-binding domain-containing protein n=1 Tax=Elizabethkingia argenteiflava TaxID=2681556 RepID=A0A845PZS7_9FLAO|nr:cyclic nucleotide-binding domain-containing protein [Elizabethkingia argenteiflava]
MDIENFSTYIQKLFHIKEQEFSVCRSLVKLKKIPKSRLLIRGGEINKELYFVERGLLRQYFTDKNGREHILYFAPENWWLGDRNSSYFNEPTHFTIEAVEDTVVVEVEPDFFINISKTYPEAIAKSEFLLHRHIRQLQKRVSLLLGATAEERYLDFLKTYPNLVMRVPQWMIASYLGVTPESLSRVRRALAKKNFLPDS